MMNIYKLFGEGGKGMLMNYMICLVVVGICKKITVVSMSKLRNLIKI